MANNIFLFGFIFFVAIQYQGGFMASSQTSHQNEEDCINYLHSTHSGLMFKLNRPSNTGIHTIGKDVEEIINKTMTDLISNCRGTITPEENINHSNKDEESLYFEDSGVGKFDFQYIPMEDRKYIVEIEELKASVNRLENQKKEAIDRGSQKLRLIDSKITVIEELRNKLKLITDKRDQEYNSGNHYYNRLQNSRNALIEEKKKYASLKENYDNILKNVCGCQRCKTDQSPNNWDILTSGRNVNDEKEDC